MFTYIFDLICRRTNVGKVEDILARLALLQDIGCKWWVLEVREPNGLLQTKRIVEEYLTRSNYEGKYSTQNTPVSLTARSYS
jgi:hypothetical protein